MKDHVATISLCLLATFAGAQEGTPKVAAGSARSTAPRVIISTDFPPLDVIPVKGVRDGDPPERCSDPDDVQSMVRFLLYVNEFEVEGLIASAGTFANVARKQNILDMLNLYDQVHEKLRRHDPRYPTAEKLRSITWQGRDGAWGTPKVGTSTKPLEKMLGEGKDSEASDAIIGIVDRPDPRPVWICVWGGSREVAQAIWKVRAMRSPAELERFLGKLRLYLIAKQDATTDWLLDTFPGLFIILSEKNYMGMFWSMPGADAKIADLAWVNANIRQGHGPLGSAYPQSGWDPKVPGVWEGDTPSFLHLVSAIRGVNDPERPDQAGWGGKFVRPDASKNHWFDDPAGTKTVYRWRPEVQSEFARRADWILPLLNANAFSQGTNRLVFLCFGQSNMEGFPGIEEQDKGPVDERFQVLAAVDFPNLGRTKGSWYPAVPPLCRPSAGLGPADYFGRTLVSNLPPNIKVGIVNVSIGGCKIELFEKDTFQTYVATAPKWMTNTIRTYSGNPYQHLVDMAKLAQKDGVIKGILLHQGESNTNDKEWPNKVKGIYDNLLKDLNLKAEEVALLAGELVHADQQGACASMNKIIDDLSKTIPTAHVISSAGCLSRQDHLHFTPTGYRELGKRYAEKMLSLLGYQRAEPK